MGDFWEGLRPLLETLGVEPWMYTVLVGFGVAHQFACGYVEKWNRGHSFLSAMAVASIFGWLSCAEHGLTPLNCGMRVVSLLAGALLAEAAANQVATRWGGIPKFNEKITKEGGK